MIEIKQQRQQGGSLTSSVSCSSDSSGSPVAESSPKMVANLYNQISEDVNTGGGSVVGECEESDDSFDEDIEDDDDEVESSLASEVFDPTVVPPLTNVAPTITSNTIITNVYEEDG